MTDLSNSQRTVSGQWLKVLLLVSPILATGCMTQGDARKLDDKFAAGWRPAKGYCAFGGETPTLNAYCAKVNFGSDGLIAVLRGENEKILQRGGGEPLPCTTHVAMARAAVKAYGDDFTAVEVYSCDRDPPVANGRKVCHVSLLVTDKTTGTRLVMDNGHVVGANVAQGVATYAEFRQDVYHAWIGVAPTWADFASR